MTSPAVQRSGAQATEPVTRSGPASSSSIPHVRAKGMVSSNAAALVTCRSLMPAP
jgi:hypothetical protein